MDDNEGLGILPDEPITESEGTETAAPVEDENPFKDVEEKEFAPETQILVLKTQVGQERRVIEMLGNKARRFGIPIISLLSPQELRGYIFIETTDVLAVQKGIRGVSYARSLVSQDVETVSYTHLTLPTIYSV